MDWETLQAIDRKNRLDENDLEILLSLSRSPDDEVRSYAAELLVMASGEQAEQTLIGLCGDEEEVVRANACDSLCAFPTLPVCRRLEEVIREDESDLVRYYAVVSLSDIAQSAGADPEACKALLRKTAESPEEGIKAACFRGLYRLGEQENLERLMDMISSSDYHVRCQAVHLLGDLITDENRGRITALLERQRATESTQAVRSAIEIVLCDQ